MRTAIILGRPHGETEVTKLIAGPAKATVMDAEFKEMRRDREHPEFAEVQLWYSDTGCALKHRLGNPEARPAVTESISPAERRAAEKAKAKTEEEKKRAESLDRQRTRADARTRLVLIRLNQVEAKPGEVEALEAIVNEKPAVKPPVIPPVSTLRTDGPTLAQYVAAGYAPESYPPTGFAVRVDAEADAKLKTELEEKAAERAAWDEARRVAKENPGIATAPVAPAVVSTDAPQPENKTEEAPTAAAGDSPAALPQPSRRNRQRP